MYVSELASLPNEFAVSVGTLGYVGLFGQDELTASGSFGPLMNLGLGMYSVK